MQTCHTLNIGLRACCENHTVFVTFVVLTGLDPCIDNRLQGEGAERRQFHEESLAEPQDVARTEARIRQVAQKTDGFTRQSGTDLTENME